MKIGKIAVIAIAVIAAIMTVASIISADSSEKRYNEAVALYEEGKKVVYAKTATNSSAGDMLSCSMAYLNDRKMIFECHDTREGSIIIDRVLDGYYNRIK